MFKKLPFILMGLIALSIWLERYIPLKLLAGLYGLSLSIKSLIIFLLPAIVFMLLFKTVTSLSSKATKILFFLLGGVCLSNFIATLLSYGIGSSITHFNLSLSPPMAHEELSPLWVLNFPKWLRTDYALFSALFLGVLSSRLVPSFAQKLSTYFDTGVRWVLQLLLCLIPLFITGFVLKLVHDNVIQNILSGYAPIFLIVITAQYSYIFSLYLVANRFSFKGFITSLKNMLPAILTGFGSMSSAAALPLTLIGAEKNTNNSHLTKLAIPTTVNIHLIGDCLAIPLFAMAIMQGFGFPHPSFIAYLIFALYFVLAKFSVAAIPGGGILVMLPILESQFGFTPEMSSLITAFYILFDPIITPANISGNGAFAMLLQFFSKRQTLVKEA